MTCSSKMIQFIFKWFHIVCITVQVDIPVGVLGAGETSNI